MRWTVFIAFAATVWAQAPGAEEQRKAIESVRKVALSYSAGLPDFLCRETVRRYRNSTDAPEWTLGDTLTLQLSFYEHREEYKLLLLNGQKTHLRYDETGGSVSQGEFGSMLAEIFVPSAAAELTWDSQTVLDGRTVQVFRYAVSAEGAHYQVRYTLNDRRFAAFAGRHGLVYLAPGGEILRLTSEADHLPPDFPVDRLTSTLDYQWTDIGGRQFLVPRRAVVEMQAGILGSKNEIEFGDYQKFSAEAGIRFDTQIKK